MKHKALKAIGAFNKYYDGPMSTRNLQRAIGGTMYKCRKIMKELASDNYIEYRSVAIWSFYHEQSLPANGYMLTERGKSLLEALLNERI